MTIKGLSSEQSQSLQNAVLKRESGGNYSAENKFGYIGGYQFGAQALQSQGLIKPGVVTDYAKLGPEGHKAILNNPDNWTIPGGKEAYLNNPQLQDQSFQRLANQNYNTLERNGVIGANTDPGDVAGYLTASHLKGAGNAINLSKGIDSADGLGTKTSSYFALGKGAVTGAAAGPTVEKITNFPKAVTTAKSPKITPASESGALKDTGVGDQVTLSGYTSPQQEDIELPITNPLEQFTSFNYIFTLSCLNASQINFPDESYKAGNLGNIVLRSGGSQPSNRVSTAYTSSYNPDGKFEFYIDNVKFEALMVYDKRTLGSNATVFSFDVIEPYSMGIFLQSLQIAASNAGYSNYLEAPFLLTVEFIGYDEFGNVLNLSRDKRHLPLKLTAAAMDVTSAGCTYKVEAVAWNEVALSDLNNLIKTDIGISGKTVQEILQSGKNSLQYALNSRLQAMAEKAEIKSAPDEIVILFPKDLSSATSSGTATDNGENSSATANPSEASSSTAVNTKLTISRVDKLLIQSEDSLNELGASSMGFDMTTSGHSELISDNFVYNSETGIYNRGRISFDKTSRTFMFAQGTSIISAITEVMLMSEFCKKAIEDNKNDANGMKTWFKIETQVYSLPAKEGNKGQGRTPKLLIYRVVPYKVHSSRFTAPSSPAEGYEQLKKEAVKVYNYIYTGKNVDILDFKINLQAGFFTTVLADYGKYGKQNTTTNISSASAEPNTTPQTLSTADQGGGIEKQVGQIQQGSNIKQPTAGGGPYDDNKTIIARQFQEALLNSPADMLTAEITIMGDPYYIADSGLGNFSNTNSGKMNITKTGAIDYQSGEVDIIVNFRTPIDIDPITGYADFGNTSLVEGFSGLYQVTEVENLFSSGKFTQVIKTVRRLKQAPVVEATKDDGSYDRVEAQRLARTNASATPPPTQTSPRPSKVDPANITAAVQARTGVILNSQGRTNDPRAPRVLEGGSATVNPKAPKAPAIDSKATATGSSTSVYKQ